jgi:probable addiction module antidote protein
VYDASLIHPTLAGLGRESLYKALSVEGNPGFGTILKVMHASGLGLQVKAIEKETLVS